MLRYLGLGYRKFGVYPLKSAPRINWEFYAVVQGRCAPVFSQHPQPRLAAQTFWVFPPGSSHGWIGIGRQRTYVTAFHFGSVPTQLEAAVKSRGHLALPLSRSECQRLVALAQTLRADYKWRTNLSNLIFQNALNELTLLALRKLPSQTQRLPEGDAERTVDNATLWYSEHLSLNPSIAAVASEIHVSTSTLRRRFHLVKQESPARVFEKIRLETAMRLLTESDCKLRVVADQCGYSSTSDFCRAFKASKKTTPEVWRRTLIGPPEAARR